MTYVAAEARQELLDVLAGATEELAAAVGALSEAYELLDEATADRLEEALFAPTQRAYGRAKRAHAEFAAGHGLPARAFAPAPRSSGGRPVKELLERAVDAAGRADARLGELQDSMLPVDVGDPQLRAALGDVRELAGRIPGAARELLRTFGR